MVLTLLVPTAVMAVEPPITVTATPVSQNLVITLSTNTIAYGDVVIDRDSAVIPFDLRNDGNVPFTVQVNPSSGFYADCMWFSLTGNSGSYSLNPSGFTTAKLNVGDTITIYTMIHPTSAWFALNGGIGVLQTGSLSFVATYAQ
jgi:hypothetical protein